MNRSLLSADRADARSPPHFTTRTWQSRLNVEGDVTLEEAAIIWQHSRFDCNGHVDIANGMLQWPSSWNLGSTFGALVKRSPPGLLLWQHAEVNVASLNVFGGLELMMKSVLRSTLGTAEIDKQAETALEAAACIVPPHRALLDSRVQSSSHAREPAIVLLSQSYHHLNHTTMSSISIIPHLNQTAINRTILFCALPPDPRDPPPRARSISTWRPRSKWLGR